MTIDFEVTEFRTGSRPGPSQAAYNGKNTDGENTKNETSTSLLAHNSFVV